MNYEIVKYLGNYLDVKIIFNINKLLKLTIKKYKIIINFENIIKIFDKDCVEIAYNFINNNFYPEIYHGEMPKIYFYMSKIRYIKSNLSPELFYDEIEKNPEIYYPKSILKHNCEKVYEILEIIAKKLKKEYNFSGKIYNNFFEELSKTSAKKIEEELKKSLDDNIIFSNIGGNYFILAHLKNLEYIYFSCDYSFDINYDEEEIGKEFKNDYCNDFVMDFFPFDYSVNYNTFGSDYEDYDSDYDLNDFWDENNKKVYQFWVVHGLCKFIMSEIMDLILGKNNYNIEENDCQFFCNLNIKKNQKKYYFSENVIDNIIKM